MNESIQASKECIQEYVPVAYDLAIVKIALQLQANNSIGNFNRLFVHLGAFHIQMAYFKAVGKFVDECVLTSIMSSADMLAAGSVNSFISGKHFNWCKRIHPITALAIHILHLRSFFKIYSEYNTDDVKAYLQTFMTTKANSPNINNENLIKIHDDCEKYRK